MAAGMDFPPLGVKPLEKRVALVIGNGKYLNATGLGNPANDALAIAAALKELAFDVIEGVDLSVLDMEDRIAEFASRIEGADTALFFFAGHGLQVDGENYLVPTDAVLANQGQLKRQTIVLQDQLNMMSGNASVSIVILDCCRDNPFVRSLARQRPGLTRGIVSRGLAEVGTDDGSFVAFATGPGSVAKDGSGLHSPFTEALLANIGNPGQSLADIMTDVTNAVTEATGETQVPWYHSSLRRRFYFKPPLSPIPVVAKIPEVVASPLEPAPPVKDAVDRSAENFVKEKSPPAQGQQLNRFRQLAVAAALGVLGIAVVASFIASGLRGREHTLPVGDLIARLDTPDTALTEQIVTYLSGPAPDAEKELLLNTVVQRLQSQIIQVDANTPIPSNCRAPTPSGPSNDPKLTLLCAGLDSARQLQALALISSIPALVWQNPAFDAPKRVLLVATADINAQRRTNSKQFLPDSTPPLNKLNDILKIGARPTSLVTLQFGGNFPRGNAQTVMDRLVSFGWRLQGVQRAETRSNEVRFGTASDGRQNASLLSEDLSLQDLTAAPSLTPSLGGNGQLDIYLNTPLSVWGSSAPQSGWCYQESDPLKPATNRDLVACHATQPACLTARGNAPQKKQSECVFVDGLDKTEIALTGGGWANSWFAASTMPFSAPFPSLPN
ncbi:caspase domain-containing protein [Rhizobium leguminosarum]|uniref:caspase family protein n=1 Tax=Rhizobium leguminosarum TaxID=384 RepID=UPI001C8FF81F|nr:caspase family protein [Rhizobium leguminosarum]MBY2937934.1 hypothetical protein [Rhizobium leguminosarum]